VSTFWEELELAVLILNALSGGILLPMLAALVAGLVVCGCVALWQAHRQRRAVAVPPPDDPAWEGLWAALLAPDDTHDVFPEEEER
jgi:hypothetical protein